MRRSLFFGQLPNCRATTIAPRAGFFPTHLGFPLPLRCLKGATKQHRGNFSLLPDAEHASATADEEVVSSCGGKDIRPARR